MIFQAKQKIMSNSFSINRNVEPIDAEIIAFARALKACHQHASTKFANNMIVYTDNKTAADIVNGKLLTVNCHRHPEKKRPRFQKMLKAGTDAKS